MHGVRLRSSPICLSSSPSPEYPGLMLSLAWMTTHDHTSWSFFYKPVLAVTHSTQNRTYFTHWHPLCVIPQRCPWGWMTPQLTILLLDDCDCLWSFWCPIAMNTLRSSHPHTSKTPLLPQCREDPLIVAAVQTQRQVTHSLPVRDVTGYTSSLASPFISGNHIHLSRASFW